MCVALDHPSPRGSLAPPRSRADAPRKPSRTARCSGLAAPSKVVFSFSRLTLIPSPPPPPTDLSAAFVGFKPPRRLARARARPSPRSLAASCRRSRWRRPSKKGKEPKRSKVEIIKENSDFLRHPLIEQLATEDTFISEDAAQLYKFHGGYQQDDREKRAFGAGKFYQFMMRTKQPAGTVPNKLYLIMDDLADSHGNGTLRLTTRQTYQLHGILKTDLKATFQAVIRNMGSHPRRVRRHQPQRHGIPRRRTTASSPSTGSRRSSRRTSATSSRPRAGRTTTCGWTASRF